MTNSLGEWIWQGTENRLQMSVRHGHSLSVLNGRWAIPDFALLLDGLSRRRFENSLRSGDANISCELCLADGQTVRMVGAFTDDDTAQGILLDSDPRRQDDDEPGPELVPVFQPIQCLLTGRVVGFEALARWPDASAEEMIDSANTFDDRALASNMLIHACEALSAWRDETGRDDVFVQVNLTSRDLVDDHLADLISALISGHKIAPGALRLELTEQAALRDAERAIEVARTLKQAGAALVLDDFGSGHSSFLWLANLPADSLKVDSTLVAQLDTPRVATILEALTLLARRLGMTITAEGVEDRKMLRRLREMGFDYAQGFALGRPMAVGVASTFLTKKK